ncbi:MAG: hypothetical protein QM534_05500 [Sediminibacterium sp.]|nr:hypothetical protein [Sediminibacterium sp.]
MTDGVSTQERNRVKEKYINDYSKIFSEEGRQSLRGTFFGITSRKHPVFLYYYKSKNYVLCTKYDLIVPPIALFEEVEIKKEEGLSRSSGIMYSGFKEGNISIDYSPNNDSIYKRFCFVHNGNYINSKIVDSSTMILRFMSEKLGIDVDGDNKLDLFFERTDSNIFDKKKEPQNATVGLRKKGNSIYMIIVLPFRSDDNEELDITTILTKGE